MRMQLWFIVHVECQRLKMIIIWWHVQVVESSSTIISVLKFQIYAPRKRNGCSVVFNAACVLNVFTFNKYSVQAFVTWVFSMVH